MEERNDLVINYLPLAKKTAGAFWALPFEDRYQEACVVLIEAAEKRDPNRPFGPFARKCIRFKLIRESGRETYIDRKYGVVDSDTVEVVSRENHFDRIETRADLKMFLSSLTSKQQMLLKLLASGNGQRTCARVMETSQASVSRMLAEIRELAEGELVA